VITICVIKLTTVAMIALLLAFWESTTRGLDLADLLGLNDFKRVSRFNILLGLSRLRDAHRRADTD